MASGEEFKPRYSLEHRDDGGRETVEVAVLLPGVQDGSSVECNVEPRLVKFRAPGRYRLSVPLSCDVDPEPLSLVFVRKKSLFKAKLLARPGAPFTLVTAIPAAQLAEAASALTAPLVPQPARSEFSGGSDEKRCASFKCKANCEASERAAGDGLRAAEAGDSMLAVKLLERACQLDPSNSAYATALRIDRAGVGSAARSPGPAAAEQPRQGGQAQPQAGPRCELDGASEPSASGAPCSVLHATTVSSSVCLGHRWCGARCLGRTGKLGSPVLPSVGSFAA